MLEPQPESPRKIYDFLGKVTFISRWLGLQDEYCYLMLT